MHTHPMQIEFLASERISGIAHEVKEERFRRGGKATGQGKVGRLLGGLLPSGLRGLTTPKPQERCC
jgi:hypothetical protein